MALDNTVAIVIAKRKHSVEATTTNGKSQGKSKTPSFSDRQIRSFASEEKADGEVLNTRRHNSMRYPSLPTASTCISEIYESSTKLRSSLSPLTTGLVSGLREQPNERKLTRICSVKSGNSYFTEPTAFSRKEASGLQGDKSTRKDLLQKGLRRRDGSLKVAEPRHSQKLAPRSSL